MELKALVCKCACLLWSCSMIRIDAPIPEILFPGSVGGGGLVGGINDDLS